MTKMNGIRSKPRLDTTGQGGCVYAARGGREGPSFPLWVAVLVQELLGIGKGSKGEPDLCCPHPILAYLLLNSQALHLVNVDFDNILKF